MHPDRLGSVRAITTATGTLTTTRTYTPYGTPTSTDTTSNFGYAGEYADTNTNLIYLRARYYQPTSGQFITEDPAVAQTKQPYLYSGGDPINHTDPSGLKKKGLFASTFASIGHFVGDMFGGAAVLANSLVAGFRGENVVSAATSSIPNNAFAQQAQGAAQAIHSAPEVAGVMTALVLGAIACAAFCEEIGGAVLGTIANSALSTPLANKTEDATCGTTSVVPYYPPNNGFASAPDLTELQPGTLFDRFGSELGRFASPAGTPVFQRALPPGADLTAYNSYRVLQPLTVQSGSTAPWFNSPGGGTQYLFYSSVQDLVDSGFIERVPR